jgi:hypothetical protein
MSADVIPFPKPKARPVPVTVAPLIQLANEIAAARERGEPCPIMARRALETVTR